MNPKIDTQLILSINPNLVYGRRRGLTDDETIQLAEETYNEMEKQIEEKAPMEVIYDEEMTESGHEINRPICPNCNQRHLYAKQRFCNKCGVEITWEGNR